MKVQFGKNRLQTGHGDIEQKQILADWCAKQTQKASLCEVAK